MECSNTNAYRNYDEARIRADLAEQAEMTEKEIVESFYANGEVKDLILSVLRLGREVRKIGLLDDAIEQRKEICRLIRIEAESIEQVAEDA